MAYVLVTTENTLRFYCYCFFDVQPQVFTLQVNLDLSVIPQHDNKESARQAAKALDLKTWRYVRIS